mmetsp:Transcript_17387/g.37545  ORF Transcript_17387/g.37545 Transcript_17387/m.37545 type:complete len:221 (-) Transcript_17387:706-1368(-)|eukprot:CAMPEP_0202901098 /NCGR_PEP_ID=MMETSP1392-20130828/13243_1 /ASSEMBLY_ACC=CAM_ASM_000868 /TAXON_ID=225041 /ORGANISM="Chlamydomonas chlamydogama, Strain SAG 11-48b" /LENGTH=220 /DNA_ID=CAMNT_0049587597 /DNA_START=83 /DNA_END=745 /DNA_ORIENTATION=+
MAVASTRFCSASRVNVTALKTLRSTPRPVSCNAVALKRTELAAAAVATVLLTATPVLAASVQGTSSQAYQQELEALIQKRTGKDSVLPELEVIPNEQAIQQAAEQAFLKEVAAEEAEPLKVTDTVEQKREVLIQSAVKAPAPAASKALSSGGTTSAGNTNIAILGGLAVLGIAAAAISSNQQPQTSDTAPAAAPAAAAPATADGSPDAASTAAPPTTPSV